MIRIAIIDDEQIYKEQLKLYIEQYSKETNTAIVIHFYNDGEDIVEAYKGNYDIILMDIQMEFMDGMRAAQTIREIDKEVIIIFITNMTQYAIKGYEVDALDYVLKPVSYFALSQKLTKAIKRIKRRTKKYLAVSISGGVQKIDTSEIYYIESQGHSLSYHTINNLVVCKGKLKEVEEELKDFGFFRTNKGYLVNMFHVAAVRNGCCIINDELLLISRARKNDFMEALTNYMSEALR